MYLDAPEPEGTLTTSQTVYCQNEDCADLDIELVADLLISHYGSYGTATYTCPTCGKDSDHDFELTDEDFGFDPDAWGDARRDEGY